MPGYTVVITWLLWHRSCALSRRRRVPFVFICLHLKKKKKSLDHTTRLRRRSSTPWIYIDKRVFAFLFFLLFVAVPTCDRCAGCRAVSVTNTLSEERVSNDKRGGRFCHLTAAANEQKSQWLLHQRCHFVHVTTWRWLLDFTRENIKTSETKKISLLLLQIFSNFYFLFFFWT